MNVLAQIGLVVWRLTGPFEAAARLTHNDSIASNLTLVFTR